MTKLKKVTINKYKCIETEQSFDVEDDITVLVGKNESGKTAILEAITKSNPYADKDFKYDITHDYPRRGQQQFKKNGEDVTVFRSKFTIPEELVECIGREIGPGTLRERTVTQLRAYRQQNAVYESIDLDIASFWEFKFAQFEIEDEQLKTLVRRQTPYAEFMSHFDGYTEKENENALLDEINEYFDDGWMTDDSIANHLVFKYLHPQMPKYLYYDEYHQLPTEIDLRELQNDQSDRKDLKTARALFALAELDLQAILGEDDEASVSAQESASHKVTSILRKYWKTNPNLRVKFHVPPQRNVHGNLVVKIRVSSNADGMTLPLNSRSRGFQWFFSFFVWFSKIQEDKGNQYILLLDEPGLNLHASAQRDLLEFIEDLAKDYQIIYTTHSPFMIDSDKLHRVRTVFEDRRGTRISESTQEKDSDTLFPLQAALGYDIAQNLFISKSNLLVEGVTDVMYLQTVSSILQRNGRTALRDNITIVPVGGAGKLASFVSLLHGQKLNFACLLDSLAHQGLQKKVENLVDNRLIEKSNIRFFHEFIGSGDSKADIEDMFEKGEYLSLFNAQFSEYDDIAESQLNPEVRRIVKQIEEVIGGKFDHYWPAYELSTRAADESFLSDATLTRFENLFKKINGLIKR